MATGNIEDEYITGLLIEEWIDYEKQDSIYKMKYYDKIVYFNQKM